jgi:hypothetical protein
MSNLINHLISLIDECSKNDEHLDLFSIDQFVPFLQSSEPTTPPKPIPIDSDLTNELIVDGILLEILNNTLKYRETPLEVPCDEWKVLFSAVKNKVYLSESIDERNLVLSILLIGSRLSDDMFLLSIKSCSSISVYPVAFQLPGIVKKLLETRVSHQAFEGFYHSSDYLIPPSIILFENAEELRGFVCFNNRIAISSTFAFPRSNCGLIDLFTLIGHGSNVV